MAAVSLNVIYIYNTVSFELLGSLRGMISSNSRIQSICFCSSNSFPLGSNIFSIGHSGQIKSICWSHDDKKLVSASNDGVIYEWSIEVINLYTSTVSNQMFL